MPAFCQPLSTHQQVPESGLCRRVTVSPSLRLLFTARLPGLGPGREGERQEPPSLRRPGPSAALQDPQACALGPRRVTGCVTTQSLRSAKEDGRKPAAPPRGRRPQLSQGGRWEAFKMLKTLNCGGRRPSGKQDDYVSFFALQGSGSLARREESSREVNRLKKTIALLQPN